MVRQRPQSMQLDALPRDRRGSAVNRLHGFHSRQARQMRPSSVSWERSLRTARIASRAGRLISLHGVQVRQAVLP